MIFSAKCDFNFPNQVYWSSAGTEVIKESAAPDLVPKINVSGFINGCAVGSDIVKNSTMSKQS